MHLRSVTAVGWRGIGPRTTLELPPGPGLVVVAGPNGSGKSSFAEAAETALTGRNSRWEKRRTGDWKQGWRNLHSPDVVPEVSVELSVGEHGEPITVRRTWYGAKVDDARTRAEGPDGAERKLGEIVDADALDLARPFLPYSELGSMINGTLSDLHDAFFKLLGLELLAELDGRVKDAVSECEKADKHEKQRTEQLRGELAELDDPRARDAVEALSGTRPDTGRVRALLASRSPAAEVELAALRRRAGSPVPNCARSPVPSRDCARRRLAPRTPGTAVRRTPGDWRICWRRRWITGGAPSPGLPGVRQRRTARPGVGRAGPGRGGTVAA
ncbi:AAA family ATPase [Streptomyces sp. INA 01156]